MGSEIVPIYDIFNCSLEGVTCQTSQFAPSPAILWTDRNTDIGEGYAIDNIRAVLWDLDGTLVDSAEYHWFSWCEALTAAGHEFDKDFLVATFGQRNDRILRTMLGPDAADAEIQRIADDKEARYRALVRKRGIELLPGAELWLKRLRASGWRQASRPQRRAPTWRRWSRCSVWPSIRRGGRGRGVSAANRTHRSSSWPRSGWELRPIAASSWRMRRRGRGCAQRRDASGVGAKHAELGASLAVSSLVELPEDVFEELLGRMDF